MNLGPEIETRKKAELFSNKTHQIIIRIMRDSFQTFNKTNSKLYTEYRVFHLFTELKTFSSFFYISVALLIFKIVCQPIFRHLLIQILFRNKDSKMNEADVQKQIRQMVAFIFTLIEHGATFKRG